MELNEEKEDDDDEKKKRPIYVHFNGIIQSFQSMLQFIRFHSIMFILCSRVYFYSVLFSIHAKC